MDDFRQCEGIEFVLPGSEWREGVVELSVVEKDLTQDEAWDMGGDLNHVFRVVVRMKTKCTSREEAVREQGGPGKQVGVGGREDTGHQGELRENVVGSNENDQLVSFVVKTAPMQVLVRQAARCSLLVSEVCVLLY